MAAREAHPYWGARKLSRASREAFSDRPMAGGQHDNAVPFATQAIHGLWYLNVW